MLNFLALIAVEIPQQTIGKTWREELSRKAGSRLLKIKKLRRI
jgi:hypothetical protein